MMREYGDWDGYSGMMNSAGWFGFGWVVPILFWVLIIWLIIVLVQHFSSERNGRSYREMEKRDLALDILRERYAKGEVSKEEFEARKNDLMKK